MLIDKLNFPINFRNFLKKFIFLIFIFRKDYLLSSIGTLWKFSATLKGARVGKVFFYGKPYIVMHPGSQVLIDDGTKLISNNLRCMSSTIFPCRIFCYSKTSLIHIKNECSLNGTSITSRSSKIIIGARVKIGPNVVIMDSPFHRKWPLDKRELEYDNFDFDKDILIGDDVWIGSGCYLLPGASIGSGSVIGANSLVNKKFPSNCFIAGSPAKIIEKFE